MGDASRDWFRRRVHGGQVGGPEVENPAVTRICTFAVAAGVAYAAWTYETDLNVRRPSVLDVRAPRATRGHGDGRSQGVARSTSGNGAPAPHARIMLRPIGSPLPLGLLALMCAGVLLSLQQIGAFALGQWHTIALVLIAFVVPLQLLASVLSFLGRDTVAGTALGLLAGAWLATALVTLSGPPGTRSPALGAFFLCLAASFLIIVAGASFAD